MLLMLGYATFYINSKMNDELSIEEYFKVVKSFWAKIFSLLFTIVEDDGDATIVAITNIPPYLMGLIAELPIDMQRGEHEGQPALFVRSKFLKQVLDRIHSQPQQVLTSPRLYRVQTIRPVSITVQWTNLMYRFWRELRIVTSTQEQMLQLRREYQAKLADHVDALKALISAQTEEMQAKDQYDAWARKLYGELNAHPDILRVSLTEKPGYIVIYTDDVVIEETGSKVRDRGGKPRHWMLGKMMIYINLSSREVTYRHENGHMPGDTERQAPHVRGRVCWGSHADVVSRALGQKNYLSAIQEAINFVQYANTGDPWGATAETLPALTGRQVTAIQERKLLRVEGASLATQSKTVSPTSFYVIKDTKAHRKILKQLGIEIALVLDGHEGYGVQGLLLEGKDINAFIKATIIPGQTVRTDSTAQTNVRQLLFVEDMEQESFVALLVDAWRKNRTKLPSTALENAKSREQILIGARMSYLKALLTQHKQEIGIQDALLDAGVMTGVFEEQLRTLLAIPEVASVEVFENEIIIKTTELRMEHKRPRTVKPDYYDLGELSIVLDFRLERPIRIYRQKGSIAPNVMSPHIVGDGIPLWGIKELQLLQFFAKGQWAQLVLECIQYVSTLRDEEMAKYLVYMQPAQTLDLETFKKAREKEIKERLDTLPSLLLPKQEEVMIEQILNQ